MTLSTRNNTKWRS